MSRQRLRSILSSPLVCNAGLLAYLTHAVRASLDNTILPSLRLPARLLCTYYLIPMDPSNRMLQARADIFVVQQFSRHDESKTKPIASRHFEISVEALSCRMGGVRRETEE